MVPKIVMDSTIVPTGSIKYGYDSGYPDGFVRQLRTIDESLKKYNERIRELKKRREFAHEKLSEWMAKKGMEEYKGIPLKTKKSKPRKKPVTKKYKKQNMLKLFNDIGVPDPEDIIQRLDKINEGQA